MEIRDYGEIILCKNIKFEDKKYNNEKYIVIPDDEGCEFGGYDGIIGVV